MNDLRAAAYGKSNINQNENQNTNHSQSKNAEHEKAITKFTFSKPADQAL